MLFSQANQFNYEVSNYNESNYDTLGVLVTASGSLHIKGSNVELLNGSLLAHDCYELIIVFMAGDGPRDFLCDLLIDPSGGSAWVTKISNLMCCGPSGRYGFYRYYFPIFIKAGTSIGMAIQSSVASASLRCAIKLRGKPSRPHLVKYGHYVETIGDDIATSKGAVLTYGDATKFKSAWTEIGTLSKNSYFWQLGVGISDLDTTSATDYEFDLASGDAVNKTMLLENTSIVFDNNERFGRSNPFGEYPPFANVFAGQTLYSRYKGGSDYPVSAIAYGVR